ncbi:putative TIR domain, P-loop containing nucleoside triphosphate hydrolase [Helianthus anomalus]
MSFRGEDTRMGFTSHLYDALTRNDIRTYKDDKTLEIGNPIASELLEAIETSRIAIVVLSSNFATSKWCLEEIAKITDCMKRGNLDVIPIFYHVSPSDVRHQSNCFEPGFSNHEADPEISSQKVEIWRSAFREVGGISGLHVTQYRDEAEVVSEILSKVLRNLPDTMPIDLLNSLVGIKSRVDEVKRILRMDSSEEVLLIGICGMSGIGKTTLAESVYKDIKNKFEKSSLVENIKDVSKQNDSSDLCKLQQKLLDDILRGKSICVQSVIHGQHLLGTKLSGLKVIIVLDDVNHVDQLTYLAGGLEWFGPGSRIIVTTTNRDLLNYYKMSEIYLCEEMNDDEALGLFCQSAFMQKLPTHGYEKLSNDIVKLAGGLPLALNVYGKLLCGKDENYWKDMLQKLKEYPEEEVLGRLEVAYARLNENQRYVFIYIACFLKGRNKDLVKDILTNIGLYSESGITDLINKCLITINLEDSVWMHDLLQQMCWKILHKESHRSDGNHIAIKYHEDIIDILSSKPKGTQAVEVINKEPYKGTEVNDCFIIDPTCFSKMTKLKFLRISNVHFPQGLNYLSNDLRILEWYRCSLKSLPSIFHPKHIYELEMCSSQLETIWKKDLYLPNLRSINLSFSKNLTKIPGLTSASNLVKLNLEGCTNLTRLHESVLLHKRLRYLNLKGCTCLQSLGRSRMEMEALEALLLSGCSKLEYIPEFGKNMKHLEHLYVDGTRIKKLPENLEQMFDLRNLDASRTFIKELPSSIHRLKRLRLLNVNRCRLSLKTGFFFHSSLDRLSSGLREVDISYCNLSSVPDGIGLLCHLITLDLSGNEFVSLPASISLLSKLRMLCLNNCERLQSLPKLSLVDDHDTDYGPRSRFNYYVSTIGLEVSKFPTASFNSCPTVSCLNCPKLAVNKRGSNLAERILNSYLQLRAKYWMTPEAVFEIVGAGSGIPIGFVHPGSQGLILEGPWIGVAICAVISMHHVDIYMESKYTVTAHIHLGEKHWKIPVPINFLVAESTTQLVIYWTVADDFQRIVGSSQKSNFGVSFSVEPEDSNLHVTNFGARFIDNEYMMHLKRPEGSLISTVAGRCVDAPNPEDHQWYVAACEDDANLHHHARKIVDLVDFIFDYGRQQASLDGIYQITKGLLEVNQEFFAVLSGCKIEWKYTQCVSSYYAMSLGASVLYNDFVQSLKDVNDGWVSVKLALEQIVVKRRADNYSYIEILEQLNDIEAPQCIGFSNKFISVLHCVFKHTCNIVPFFNEELRRGTELSEKKFKRVKVLAKISSITILAVLCMMAAYIGELEPLKELKQSALNSLWLRLFIPFTDKRRFFKDGVFIDTHCSSELQISDFYENGIFLQSLMNKMGRASCFTKENEEEMTSVIDKLQMNIHKLSSTIQVMSIHADQYSHDLGKGEEAC